MGNEIAWRRKYVRLRAEDAVAAEMRISAIGGRPVKTPSRKVLLLGVSPQSLRFQTSLWLPPDEGWTVMLSFALEAVPLRAAGEISSARGDGHWWTYDVELEHNRVAAALLSRVLEMRLRRRAPALYRMQQAYGKHRK